ncbi:MAG: ankyrin repeat domain-containing protein [Alphaproteobacteria bacterium]|nr:ankyrin repeat domain-containing protein [Alphaproteobacteria bacterium]
MIKNTKSQTILYCLILLHTQTHYRLFLDIAKIIIKCGIDVNKANEYGETPLHLATRLENKEAYHFLIKNGANRFARTKNGETIADFCLQKTIEQMAQSKWISKHHSISKHITQSRNQNIRQ